jgi:hypothetical protein
MKYIIALSLCLLSILSYGQEIKAEFDGHKWEAPYQLNIPNGWTIERFLVPISFAPQIAYKGVEDIRFAPGWANAKSDEYWTYAFLWYLDAKPQTNEKIIADNLKAYYSGLIKVNSDPAKAAREKPMPVTTSFRKTTTHNDDLETYTGKVMMLDYMQRKPIVLNCIVHLKICADSNKSILFYELSPKPFTHSNWKALDQLWLNFKCKKS